MQKSLRIYFILVAIGAVIFCVLLDWSALQRLTVFDWVGLGTFLGLAALAQSLEVESTLGASKPIKVSIAFLPLLALGVVMPVPAVVVAAGGMTTIHELFFRERDYWRALFNISQTGLSYGIAAVVYAHVVSLGDLPDGAAGFDGISQVILPFFALAATFFVLNLLFVSTVLALRQSEPLMSVLSAAMGRGGGNLLFDLLASPIALFAALLYENYFIGGLLIVVLPLLLIRHSYLAAIQLQQANRDLLNVLVKAIETRDPYTSGHSRRVKNLAKLIATDFGLRSPTVANIEQAALLHDIGKIDAIYATIISKPAELTEHERRVIRTHSVKGADILQSLTSLDKEVVLGVRHHHEMFDGSGYPDGLVGKRIPLAARIIMICDAVDAMLSDRPYRSALSVDEVRDELRRCAGTQFDPDLVRTILDHNTLERAEVLVDLSGARSAVRAAAALA